MPTLSVNTSSFPATADRPAITDADRPSEPCLPSGENVSPHLATLANIRQKGSPRSEKQGANALAAGSSDVPHVDLAEQEAIALINPEDIRNIKIAVRDFLENTRKCEKQNFSPADLSAAGYVHQRIGRHEGLGNRDVWSLSFNGNLQAICEISRSPRTLEDGRKFVELESVLALPGTKGYGSAIVQLAVNHAQHCHYSGRVVVEPIENSVEFFETMGFEKVNGMFCLDPAKHKDWGFCEEKGGVWQFSKANPRVSVTGINLPSVIGNTKKSNAPSFDRAMV